MSSKRKESSREYYLLNRPALLEEKRAYKLKNPDKVNKNWRIADARRRKIKAAFIKRYKMAAGCFDCGFNSHSEALHFDHVNKDKKGNVAHIIQKSWKSLLTEIQKCVIRCANCHAIKTKEEQYGDRNVF